MDDECDSVCDRCGSECNSDEKNMCKDGGEVCNECFAELVTAGKESLD
jgi:hypothetical protein